ncbi:MAG TPA: transcription termination factor Rho [Candidatus Bathyarchaeia archaeon]|nr:transcription termination factor Rho [Candidatus Bathyarchaeia archaeon]
MVIKKTSSLKKGASKRAVSVSKPALEKAAKAVSVEELVGGTEVSVKEFPVEIKPDIVAPPIIEERRGIGFNGVVDNRRIPDADVPTEIVEGILEMGSNDRGILRPQYIASDNDIYISSSQIRRFNLRPGDLVSGPARQPKENERYWGLLKVEKVNGVAIEKMGTRPNFDQLTPIYPNEQIKLETDPKLLSTRLIDLIAPIGKGQRGLIVSPPKAGKTTILKQIASAIAQNDKKAEIMAVLVGERPEEVTDIRHGVKGEVIASNFDEAAEKQTRTAEIALERAKRLVELGKDVIVLLDSITRLARAYNLAIPTSGRTLSGGFDPAALYPPKRFFGAARNFEKGGSLTIIGTALVDTGSRMDELIYEEFKGTGNMELHLDRGLEQRRVFPAIDVQKSGTRQEQLLFDDKTYEQIITLRRMLDVLNKDERTELLLERLRKTKTNKEFLDNLTKG